MIGADLPACEAQAGGWIGEWAADSRSLGNPSKRHLYCLASVLASSAIELFAARENAFNARSGQGINLYIPRDAAQMRVGVTRIKNPIKTVFVFAWPV
jgi:hypothetical protein